MESVKYQTSYNRATDFDRIQEKEYEKRVLAQKSEKQAHTIVLEPRFQEVEA